MSRLGKRRANCASEEEGAIGGEEDGAGIKRREPHSFRFGELTADPSTYVNQPLGLYAPQIGTSSSSSGTGAGFDGSEYTMDVPSYMVQQTFNTNSSAYLNPLNYYQLPPAMVSDGTHQQQQGQIHNFAQSAEQSQTQKMNNKDDLNGDKEKVHGQQHVALPNATNYYQLFPNRSPFEPFCTVPGRTSLLSSTTKYKVTIGEIQRRINPPECLNASLIGGILRKAKSKDGGKALRESLKRIGLTLPAGRRKSACVTAFTAMVEEEAIHMANDFHAVLQRDFPAKDVGVFLNSQYLHFSGQQSTTDVLVGRRKAILNCARLFIREFLELVAADRSPICDRRPDLLLEPSIQKPLTHFSMITHGFGGIALLSMLEMLNTCLNESMKSLDKMIGGPTATTNEQIQFEQSNSSSSATLQSNGF